MFFSLKYTVKFQFTVKQMLYAFPVVDTFLIFYFTERKIIGIPLTE